MCDLPEVDCAARVASAAAENAELRSRLDEVRALLKWSGVSREVLREALGDVATESDEPDEIVMGDYWPIDKDARSIASDEQPRQSPVLAPAHDDGSDSHRVSQEAKSGARQSHVTFHVGDNWPTPNHCRRTADALDTLTPARYGDILRAYADAEDARFEQTPYSCRDDWLAVDVSEVVRRILGRIQIDTNKRTLVYEYDEESLEDLRDRLLDALGDIEENL